MELGLAIALVLIGLPWLILHYVTKWKTAATITVDDEHLLEELHRLARRLEERMDTVERLVAADHPEFRPPRLAEADDDTMGRGISAPRQTRERSAR